MAILRDLLTALKPRRVSEGTVDSCLDYALTFAHARQCKRRYATRVLADDSVRALKGPAKCRAPLRGVNPRHRKSGRFPDYCCV